MENIITLKNICKTYGSGDGLVTALKPVSLEIGEGEMVAVMGKSGSDDPPDSPNSQSSDFTFELLRLHLFLVPCGIATVTQKVGYVIILRCRVASPPEHKSGICHHLKVTCGIAT